MEQRTLKELVLNWGASLVGFADLGESPINGQNLRYAVSIAVKLSNAVLKTIDGAPSFTYFQHYRSANSLLDTITFKLTETLERSGYSAFPIAASQSLGKNNPYAGVVAHKTVAVKAGLGFVGKSGLFLSDEYGSKVRLATVLTDMPLSAEKPIRENGCGDCTACMRACPAGAIFGELPTTDGERNFDAEKCSKYMKEHFQDIGRGSVCGVCIKVCPKNKL
jgi:epoxyqueuosine reductase QueG